jgi:hypothetical protein
MRSYSTDYPRNLFLEALNNTTGLSRLLTSGIRITNIVGDLGATSTVEKIRVVAGSNPLWIHGKPDGFDGQSVDRGLEKSSGDGTVTVYGATLDNTIINEQFESDHQRIPVLAQSRVFNLLTNKVATTTFDHHYGVDVKMVILQLFSPIDFVVIAPDGKKLGKNFNGGGEYNEIPDAFYSGYGTAEEYVTISNPIDGEYKVQLQGTGSGVYAVATSYISDIVSTTTEIVGTTTQNQINNISIQFASSSPADISVDPDLVADINKSFELGWIKDKKVRDQLLKKAEAVIKFEKKIELMPDGKNKVKRVERLNRRIDKKVASALLLDLRAYNKDKITIEGYNLLKGDLEWIISH